MLLRRPVLSLLVVALVSALVGAVLASVSASDSPPRPVGATQTPTSGTVALTITTDLVREVSWPLQVQASGAIAPWQEAIISSSLGGMPLVELNVEVGDSVTKGQVLARLDTDTLRAEEAELEAGVAEARAILAEAEANRDRALAMGRIKALSEQEIQQSVTRAKTTRAQLASAEARLASKRVQLRHAEIRTPDDGVISARSATLGSVASSGQELFRLIRQNRLEWHGELNASQVGLVAPGQSVILRLPDGARATAVIRKIAPAMDSQSRLASLYADLEPGSSARAGMYVEALIELESTPALTVPSRSIVINDGHSYVFLAEGEGKIARVARQRVEVGRRQGDEVEVVDGLDAGQRVAVDGAGFLADQDQVRIVASTQLDSVSPESAYIEPTMPQETPAELSPAAMASPEALLPEPDASEPVSAEPTQ